MSVHPLYGDASLDSEFIPLAAQPRSVARGPSRALPLREPSREGRGTRRGTAALPAQELPVCSAVASPGGG